MVRYKYLTLSAIFILSVIAAKAQNVEGKSDDYSRIAISPVVTEQSVEIPQSTAEMLIGKMRQIISLNGLSALDDAPLFIMSPEIVVISNELSPTTPPMYTIFMELTFNLADRYTGNVYASATESLKSAGKSETAAYNSAIKNINVRSGKYKMMLEEGKKEILEYYNVHCDLVISRAKSLAAQKNYEGALALLNSVPPVSRECFDKANAVATEIGENMPEQKVEIADAKEPEEQKPVYASDNMVDLDNNIFLKYTYGENIGEKTMLHFELINKNQGDFEFEISRVFETMLIDEKGNEVYIESMKIGSKESRYRIKTTLIPAVNTKMVCKFPKVNKVNFLRFNINDNQFKFSNLPIEK